MTDYSLQLLKDQFPNIDFEDAYYDLDQVNQAFIHVAECGHLEICKWLMQFNPDVHAYDDYAFRYAAQNGYLEVCKWLMQFNPDVHGAFRWAASNGQLEVCKWLMQFNPNVHIYDDYAFRWAAHGDHLEVCKWLIEIDKDLIKLLNNKQLKKLNNYVNLQRKKSAR